MAVGGGQDKEAKRSRLGNRRQRALYKHAKGKTLTTGEYERLCQKADSINGIRRAS